ncbi:hypothetical protein MVLG_03077 [Microbotryum lychnidis-dioicae p1A1 Lamole]|uniref:Zn(2)-C6 fungal-type domain-containing protein n=1 Tax=Microbotryum lychnidis-dioicae (strain p1A1 Lamole / MvSl-1064) TaxID=683840 RepID=U5H738_USTV1|nr:hypothetical protein MVLG_03077 [Microbotryum lychnidis-dioicae p1A1 Lamole]|eukprot:KDE06581.1 hypothetical protein MVLG_03077 [Microbotryum lychnidis-dioicae p1A1 Lamole]
MTRPRSAATTLVLWSNTSVEHPSTDDDSARRRATSGAGHQPSSIAMSSMTNSSLPTTDHGMHQYHLGAPTPSPPSASAGPAAPTVPLTESSLAESSSGTHGNITVAPSSCSSSTKATSPTSNTTALTTARQLKKKSQRPSWSCTECTRRKIKCDRNVPGCSACRRRNAVDQCRLDESLLLESAGMATTLGLKRRRSSSSTSQLPPPSRNPLHKPEPEQSARRSPISSPAAASLPSFTDLTPGLHVQFEPPTVLVKQNSNGMKVTSISNAAAMEHQALNNVVKGLRAQLSQLEKVVSRISSNVPGQSKHPNGTTLSITAANAGSRPEGATASNESSARDASPPEPDGELEAAETLEFLAMGRDRKAQHLSRSELRRPADEEDAEDAIVVDSTPSTSAGGALSWLGASPTSLVKSPIATLLPHPSGPSADASPALLDDRRSRLVACWAMSHMLAHNALLHPPTFLAECIEFENWPPSDRYRLVNAAWLGLYYAVLCGALQQMSRHDATQMGLSIDEYHRLPKVYFDACVQALHRADFLSKHSRFSVQAICIVTTAGYEAGQSDLINTLLGCAIRIAQHLQFHRLGSDLEWQTRQARKGVVLTNEMGIKSAINREICKRLWCTLGADDWFTCTVRHSYAIHSTHTNTPLPLNITDEDLSIGALSKALPYDVPTPASKLILLHSLADRVRTLFDLINGSDKPSQELTNEIDSGIDEVMQRAPGWLKMGWIPPVGMKVPSWVAELRQHWFISCEHKRLVLHRLCPSRGLFRDTAHPYVRQAAVKAARKVLHHFTETDKWPRNWTISYHAIVACTTLLLDLSHRNTSSSSTSNSPSASTLTPIPVPQSTTYLAKRSDVLSALECLRLISDDSIIASRGIRLIEAMLKEEGKSKALGEFWQNKNKDQVGDDFRGKAFNGSHTPGPNRVDLASVLQTGPLGPTSVPPPPSQANLLTSPSLGATLFDPSLRNPTTAPLTLVDTFDLSTNTLGTLLQNLPVSSSTSSIPLLDPAPNQTDNLGAGLRLGFSTSSPLGRGDDFAALESMLLDGFGRDWEAFDHGGAGGVGGGGGGGVLEGGWGL